MADGYSQIYGHGTFVIFDFWRYDKSIIVACVVVASAATLGAGLWLVRNTNRKED